MNKIDLGRAMKAIAEVAAIAGIALLAYELHQNNEILETQASLARLQNRVGASTLLATDSELGAAVIKDKGGEPLSELEAFKVENQFGATLAKWEWEYRHTHPASIRTCQQRTGERSSDLFLLCAGSGPTMHLDGGFLHGSYNS